MVIGVLQTLGHVEVPPFLVGLPLAPAHQTVVHTVNPVGFERGRVLQLWLNLG